MIEYEAYAIVKVRLDGKLVGHITQDDDGNWRYYPGSCQEGGEPFPTLKACKLSLE